MIKQIPMCDSWTFSLNFNKNMILDDYDLSNDIAVTLPHTAAETPLNYFDEKIYQVVCGYRKVFSVDKKYKNNRIFVKFMAVAHVADVYLNGEHICTHKNGYTAFEIEITDKVRFDKENVLALSCSGTEQDNVPPFGHVVDYMTYAGIYGNVYLEIRPQTFIEDVYIETIIPNEFVYNENKPFENLTQAALNLKVKINGLESGKFEEKIFLKRFADDAIAQDVNTPLSIREAFAKDLHSVINDIYKENTLLSSMQKDSESDITQFKGKVKNVSVWDHLSPVLYELTCVLYKDDEEIDEKKIRFGFRKAKFYKDGFYLNNRKFKIIGLNRHQS